MGTKRTVLLEYPERRHVSTRVPGHAFHEWCSLWRIVVYIYYITAAGNSINSQLGSSCQGKTVRYGKGRRYGPSITYKITPARSLSPPQASQVCRCVGPASSLRPHWVYQYQLRFFLPVFIPFQIGHSGQSVEQQKTNYRPFTGNFLLQPQRFRRINSQFF